jgi:hypothetical protein
MSVFQRAGRKIIPGKPSILKKFIGPLISSMQQMPVDINLTTVDPGARDPAPVLG